MFFVRLLNFDSNFTGRPFVCVLSFRFSSTGQRYWIICVKGFQMYFSIFHYSWGIGIVGKMNTFFYHIVTVCPSCIWEIRKYIERFEGKTKGLHLAKNCF